MLITLLLLAFTGCAVALTRSRALPLQLLAGLGALLSSAVLGISLVNSYYDYYQSWGSLWADVRADNGAPAAPALVPVRHPRVPGGGALRRHPRGHGRLVSISMPGRTSGVQGRSGLVWLPPQYDEPRYAGISFPVLELLHGDPGDPGSWTNGLDVPGVLDHLGDGGGAGPMVVVMPDITGAFHLQQCLDVPHGPSLDRYLRADVPADLAARVRVEPPGPDWAVGGLSSGGFCAARLGLRHPDAFGAVAVMDGYFHVDVGGSLRRRLYGPRPAAAGDDPSALLAALPPNGPLPAFWIMAGTANAKDYRDAIVFATAVGRREDLRFLTVVGGRHTTPAWRVALPDLLAWAAAAVHGHPAAGQSSVPL